MRLSCVSWRNARNSQQQTRVYSNGYFASISTAKRLCKNDTKNSVNVMLIRFGESNIMVAETSWCCDLDTGDTISIFRNFRFKHIVKIGLDWFKDIEEIISPTRQLYAIQLARTGKNKIAHNYEMVLIDTVDEVRNLERNFVQLEEIIWNMFKSFLLT